MFVVRNTGSKQELQFGKLHVTIDIDKVFTTDDPEVVDTCRKYPTFNVVERPAQKGETPSIGRKDVKEVRNTTGDVEEGTVK